MAETIIKTIVTVLISAAVGGGITYLGVAGKLIGRVRDLEKWRKFIQQDTEDSAEERMLLLRSVLACLYGLQEQGCNGPVSNGIESLEQYLDKQAHRIKSRFKEG